MLIPHIAGLSGSEEVHVDEPSQIDEIVMALQGTLRDGALARWRELRAAEVVIGEVAGVRRGPLSASAAPRDRPLPKRPRGAHRDLQSYLPPFEREEPGEEEIELVRDGVEREVEHATSW